MCVTVCGCRTVAEAAVLLWFIQTDSLKVASCTFSPFGPVFASLLPIPAPDTCEMDTAHTKNHNCVTSGRRVVFAHLYTDVRETK